MTQDNEAQDLLAQLNESLPKTTVEMLQQKGVIHIQAYSSTKKPRLGDTAYTKAWHHTGKAKKHRSKMVKNSRRKNRRKK